MKKIFALVMLVFLMCCCSNQSQNKPVKLNREVYPEKFTGAYLNQRAQNLVESVEAEKTVKTLGIINDSIAKIKINYLGGDHHMILVFDEGEWVLDELDGVKSAR